MSFFLIRDKVHTNTAGHHEGEDGNNHEDGENSGIQEAGAAVEASAEVAAAGAPVDDTSSAFADSAAVTGATVVDEGRADGLARAGTAHVDVQSSTLRKLFLVPWQPPYTNLSHAFVLALKAQRVKYALHGPVNLLSRQREGMGGRAVVDEAGAAVDGASASSAADTRLTVTRRRKRRTADFIVDFRVRSVTL